MSGFSATGGPMFAGGSCESLVIDTLLASPRPEIVALINPGDVLDVRLITMENGIRPVVVVFRSQIAGGLASPAISRLRECIEGGTFYQARVTGKRDALVRVRVTVARQ